MSGRYCGDCDGVASVRKVVPVKAMSQPSPSGSDGSGRPLKKAQKEGRTIVFIDESGISQRPHRVRTWAPRGQTPILQFNFNCNKMSAISGLSFFNFSFQLIEGSFKSRKVISIFGDI